MSDDDRVMIFEAWDRLDSAAQRMLISQPAEMAESAKRLDHERRNMRAVLQSVLVRIKKP
jgi:hypothetical protein